MNKFQLDHLFDEFDKLQLTHGGPNLKAIYGAGKIDSPKICLIFMNPTAKNISASPEWNGIRAPWLGIKNVWRLLIKLGFIDDEPFINTLISLRSEQWTTEHAIGLYEKTLQNSIYITNLAKCTQEDARHLPNSVFKDYRKLMLKEIEFIQPGIIVTMGNQVSSVLLEKQISVSKYTKQEYEELTLLNNQKVRVYPTYYPIGQGMRNMQKAIERIRKITS